MPEFLDDWMWSMRIDPAEHGLTFAIGFALCAALVTLGAFAIMVLA